MSNVIDKEFFPEVIQENPFPNEVVTSISPSSQNAKDNFAPSIAKDKIFPVKRSAVELLSTALNTRSRKVLENFELVKSGGFQIGDFQEGLTGDIRITPNGITARDLAGLISFVLDGTDGSAVFRGEIKSGSIVTGQVVVGNNGVIIDVDDNGQPSIIVNDGANDRVIIGFQQNGF